MDSGVWSQKCVLLLKVKLRQYEFFKTILVLKVILNFKFLF